MLRSALRSGTGYRLLISKAMVARKNCVQTAPNRPQRLERREAQLLVARPKGYGWWELGGGRYRTRTYDLVRVKHAL
jgi:hypothetical protein